MFILRHNSCLSHLHSFWFFPHVLHFFDHVFVNINPANILLNPDSGIVKVIDFGISGECSKEKSDEQNFKSFEGSLTYISPEQTGRMNRHVNYLTDYYSLRATFFEMMTGRPVFEADEGFQRSIRSS